MSEQSYPQNLPYMQSNSSNRPSRIEEPENTRKSKLEISNSEILMSRIQDLQKELSSLTALLMEDGGFQQAYAQLQQQNVELKSVISEQEGYIEQSKELQISNQLLKQNLLKQNEEMQDLYRELQQSRHSNSRMQDRGQSELLQAKVKELNDQISNLLVKIQELVDENNQLINNQQGIEMQFENMMQNLNKAENEIKEMHVQNEILKEEIHNVEEMYTTQQKEMQDRYMKEIEDMAQQIDDLKSNLMKSQSRPGQIRGNTERITEDRLGLQQEINAIRAELATKNEELVWQRENQSNIRRKWQERMTADENQTISLNEQISKLRTRVRQQESKCSQYEFLLQQQQKDRQRLNFYKNSYADSEQLRSTIVHLQAQKEELNLRVERLKVQLSQRKFQPNVIQIERIQSPKYNFIQGQVQDELQKCKKLNKQLKIAIGKYEQDYKQIRKDYQNLLEEKVKAERIINSNQLELERHKGIYQQVVTRYNETASLYKQLQLKLKSLESDRNSKIAPTLYDKENIQLIKLQNSTLRQEISSLREELSAKIYNNNNYQQDNNLKRQLAEFRKRQREYAQQLELYRQKYLRELQKSKVDKELQGKVDALDEKLSRVNRMLNEKMKEIEYLQNRQKELLQEVDQAYIKCKHQFDTYGVRHHPQVKKLQSELIIAQRHLMESQLVFKQQITSCEDELRSCRLENQHHRAKIDQLLLEVNRERNSLDYSKLMRSLQLSELTGKELNRQLQHRDNVINELRDQLKNMQNRQRNRLQASVNNREIEQLRYQKETYEHQIREQDSRLHSLSECLNALEPNSRSEDTLKRAINYLSKIAANSVRNSFSENGTKQSRQTERSRYQELAKKKSLITEHFKYSQQFLTDQGASLKEQKHGILQRLRQNLAI